ncbi:hypothetical protein Lalb_Chr16g0382911 [Lupinus albus]|uniref:Uncharacterized protein n=1 Tax=Lupinus albus TaxID=3870 RepID=A0A6A4P352_LUPAL|nr:hypothetical protein Lalb_Chr16g0382911 [Lupinus albus]
MKRIEMILLPFHVTFCVMVWFMLWSTIGDHNPLFIRSAYPSVKGDATSFSYFHFAHHKIEIRL